LFQLLLSLVRYHFRLYFVSVLLIISVSVHEIISFSVSVSVSVNEYITGSDHWQSFMAISRGSLEISRWKKKKKRQ